MKFLILLILTYLLIISIIQASPMLVSDPYPPDTVQPTTFTITGLPTGPIIDVPATVNPDKSVYLNYDLARVPKGTFTITITPVAKDTPGPVSSYVIDIDPDAKKFNISKQ